MTVTLTAGTGRPIRLRRPPLLEPPFDDDPTVGDHVPPPELPLDWHPAEPLAGPEAAAAPVTVTAPVAPPGVASRAPQVPARRGDAGDAVATAQRYVQVCLEVLNGFRPAAHLRTLTGPVEFTAVIGQLARRRNSHGRFTDGPPPAYRSRPLTAPPTPGAPGASGHFTRPGQAAAPDQRAVARLPEVGAGYGGNRGPGAVAGPVAGRGVPGNAGRATHPYRLLRLRLSEPRDGVAEVVAVLSHAGMSLAMAMRLECRSGRWQCALVQII